MPTEIIAPGGGSLGGILTNVPSAPERIPRASHRKFQQGSTVQKLGKKLCGNWQKGGTEFRGPSVLRSLRHSSYTHEEH